MGRRSGSPSRPPARPPRGSVRGRVSRPSPPRRRSARSPQAGLRFFVHRRAADGASGRKCLSRPGAARPRSRTGPCQVPERLSRGELRRGRGSRSSCRLRRDRRRRRPGPEPGRLRRGSRRSRQDDRDPRPRRSSPRDRRSGPWHGPLRDRGRGRSRTKTGIPSRRRSIGCSPMHEEARKKRLRADKKRRWPRHASSHRGSWRVQGREGDPDRREVPLVPRPARADSSPPSSNDTVRSS